MLKKFSHIEFCVGNIHYASFFYKNAFNFKITEKLDPVIDSEDIISLFVRQNHIKLKLTSPIDSHGEVARFLQKHGEGIRDVAFIVDDVEHVFMQAIKNGACASIVPTTKEIEGRRYKFARVSMFGAINHTLIESVNEEKDKLFNRLDEDQNSDTDSTSSMFSVIDHIAICVDVGKMNDWIDLYINAFNLKETFQENIDTGKSGMNSKVLESVNGSVKIVFTEPMAKYENSQIQNFINQNNGPGIQHIALATDDIIHAASSLEERGVALLNIPTNYYDILLQKKPELAAKADLFKKHNILYEQNKEGCLYQLFTQSIQTRSTNFFEIIQREGVKGFGTNNVKILFKAIELEQENK